MHSLLYLLYANRRGFRAAIAQLRILETRRLEPSNEGKSIFIGGGGRKNLSDRLQLKSSHRVPAYIYRAGSKRFAIGAEIPRVCVCAIAEENSRRVL